MLIKKIGQIGKPSRTFECINCGCIYEAEYSEYEVKRYKSQRTDVEARIYECKCPCCNEKNSSL